MLIEHPEYRIQPALIRVSLAAYVELCCMGKVYRLWPVMQREPTALSPRMLDLPAHSQTSLFTTGDDAEILFQASESRWLKKCPGPSVIPGQSATSCTNTIATAIQ